MPSVWLELPQLACKPTESALHEYLAIAALDFQCFFHYRDALSKKGNSKEDIGLCILPAEKFFEMFGESMILRTCVHLAIRGKPFELYIKVVGE